MKSSRIITAILPLFVACFWFASCAQKESSSSESQSKLAQTTPAQDEAAIRALDTNWSSAIGSKDADKSSSFYADNGTLLEPGGHKVTGKDAIAKSWAGLMAMPGFALSFAPQTIHVSQSGDLAYDLGTWQMTANDKKGKPQTSTGVYLVVWGKQSDGSWKVLVDGPTTAMP